MNRLIAILAVLLAACAADATVIPDSAAPASATPSSVLDPSQIDPCSLVSGGPSQTIAVDDQDLPVMDGSNFVDYEDWRNRDSRWNDRPEALTAVGGKVCFFLLPEGIGSAGQDAVLQLRDERTATAEAMELTATLFEPGPPPFSDGSIAAKVNGHPAALGTLIRQPSLGGRPNMALAVSAEPYFLVVMFNLDESILGLSDPASAIWWETYGERDLGPGIGAVAAEILAELGR